MTSRERALAKIEREIRACKICRKDKVGVPVPGEGSANAKVVFIGEAPGKKESVVGKPFIGPSGKFLRQLIAAAGLKDSEIFITSPVKYLPKHVTPKPAEIEHGKIHLFRQLQVIKPKFVVLLGRVACLAVLGQNCSIANDHGKIIGSKGVSYFLSYHPAAALHSPGLRSVLARDFKKLKKLTSTK